MSYYSANVRLYWNGTAVNATQGVLAFGVGDTVPDATVSRDALDTGGLVTLQPGGGSPIPTYPVTVVGTPANGNTPTWNNTTHQWEPGSATSTTVTPLVGGSPTDGPNLWLTPTAGENTSATPSLTANGTAQTLKTRLRMPGTADQLNGEVKIRLTWDLSCTITSGWAGLCYFWADNTGVILGGTSKQFLFSTPGTAITNYTGFVELTVPNGAVNIEIQLETANNAPSGVLSINSFDVRRIGYVRPPLVFGYNSGTPGTAGAVVNVFVPITDPVSKLTTWKQQSFSTDSALETAMNQANLFTPTSGDWQNSPLNNTGTITGATPTISRAGSSSLLHSNNIGQIIDIWTGSTDEVRGNAHGGEAGRSGTYGTDFTFEYDLGDGVWRVPQARNTLAQFCRRMRFTQHTKMYASAAGAGSPFANVDYTWTFFDDGTVRQDRTTTFIASQALYTYFVFMITFGSGTRQLQGKAGAGKTVHGTMDTRSFLSVPTISSVTTSTTGGTLPAATYNYRITRVSLYGETTASAAVAQVTTGATSSNTVNFPATVTNQIGWRVYNANGLLATLQASATSYLDTGAVGGFGQPPVVNSAWDVSTAVFDSVNSLTANWTVFREPTTGVCHAVICDRDDILAKHPSADTTRFRIMQAAGITKIYMMVEDNAGSVGPSSSNQNYGTYPVTIANGTTITNTSWFVTYLPKDTVNYEADFTERAAAVTALATAYPST